jgi:hypothetical protein
MQLEFHQLDRRWEICEYANRTGSGTLVASLAESGQQTPSRRCCRRGPARGVQGTLKTSPVQ